MPLAPTAVQRLGPFIFGGLWAAGLGTLLALTLDALPGGWLVALPVMLGLCVTIAIGVISQRCGFFASPVNEVPGASGRVCLTFDDGPHPEFTARVLDLLAASGQRATFFVVGRRLERHPELARRMVDEGHELGNHTMDHAWHMSLWTVAGIAADLEATARLARQAAGVTLRLFRPPAAVLSPRIAAGAQRAGVTLVGYSARTGDGSPLVPPRVVLARATAGLRPGAILLLHDGAVAGQAPASCEVLPRLLETMKQRGLTSVPLSELLRQPGR